MAVMGTNMEVALFCLVILFLECTVWCEVNMLPQFLCLFGARVSHKRPDMAAGLHSSVAHRGLRLHTAVVSVGQSA